MRITACIGFSFTLAALAIFSFSDGPLQPIASEWVIFFFTFNIMFFASILIAVISSFELAVIRAEDALQTEFSRAKMLLHNILPANIELRLKAREEPLADQHDSVSILFADLAGFTNLSRTLSTGELVNLLNDLFSRFDDLANKHGAEKIKTIGDTYMVATGLSGNVADHAEKIADLGLGLSHGGDHRPLSGGHIAWSDQRADPRGAVGSRRQPTRGRRHDRSRPRHRAREWGRGGA